MQKPSTHLFLIWALVLVLAGSQGFQHSPLHDHDSAVTDCVLCHFQLDDGIATVERTHYQYGPAASIYTPEARIISLARVYQPYLSRSPPALSS